jgi:hypothetical protein
MVQSQVLQPGSGEIGPIALQVKFQQDFTIKFNGPIKGRQSWNEVQFGGTANDIYSLTHLIKSPIE